MKPRTPNNYICARCRKIIVKNSTKDSIRSWCDVTDMTTVLHKYYDGAKKVNKNTSIGLKVGPPTKLESIVNKLKSLN